MCEDPNAARSDRLPDDRRAVRKAETCTARAISVDRGGAGKRAGVDNLEHSTASIHDPADAYF
jgi:hypothetical protein